eukprot:6207224-Pleurochrysis_carterae.AAC.1
MYEPRIGIAGRVLASFRPVVARRFTAPRASCDSSASARASAARSVSRAAAPTASPRAVRCGAVRCGLQCGRVPYIARAHRVHPPPTNLSAGDGTRSAAAVWSGWSPHSLRAQPRCSAAD